MKTSLLFFVWMASSIAATANPPEEGKTIFLSRCAACHNVNKPMTGPALAGVDQRRSFEWITSFVQSSQSMVKKGDTAALAVFQRFNKVPMPDHADLNADDIKNIVSYIKAETKTVTDEAPFARPGAKKTMYSPLSLQNYWVFIGFFFAVIGLIASLYFAVQMKSFQLSKKLGD